MNEYNKNKNYPIQIQQNTYINNYNQQNYNNHSGNFNFSRFNQFLNNTNVQLMSKESGFYNDRKEILYLISMYLNDKYQIDSHPFLNSEQKKYSKEVLKLISVCLETYMFMKYRPIVYNIN